MDLRMPIAKHGAPLLPGPLYLLQLGLEGRIHHQYYVKDPRDQGPTQGYHALHPRGSEVDAGIRVLACKPCLSVL